MSEQLLHNLLPSSALRRQSQRLHGVQAVQMQKCKCYPLQEEISKIDTDLEALLKKLQALRGLLLSAELVLCLPFAFFIV